MVRLPWRRKEAERLLAAIEAANELQQRASRPPPPTFPGESLTRDYVYPDYVDDHALAALAQAKGVALDPVTVGESRSRTVSSSYTNETAASLRSPVGEVGVRTSETASDERSVGRSIAVQQRKTMRWVVDELAAVLRAEGALREDLAAVPPECEPELMLGIAVRNATARWGLSEVIQRIDQALGDWNIGDSSSAETAEIDPDPAEPQPSPESAPDEPAPIAARRAAGAGVEWEPQMPTPRQLALSLMTLTYTASTIIAERITDATKQMLQTEKRTIFALVTMRWGYWGEGAATHLWNGGLVSPYDRDFFLFGPAPAVLNVPIDEEKLNPLARARYVHRGEYQPLQVFAKIERVDYPPSIVLTPLVILSA